MLADIDRGVDIAVAGCAADGSKALMSAIDNDSHRSSHAVFFKFSALFQTKRTQPICRAMRFCWSAVG